MRYGRVLLIASLLIPVSRHILFDQSVVYATPGPDSVLLVINQQSDVSRQIATVYQQERFILPQLICEVSVSPVDTIDHEVFFDEAIVPISHCLSSLPNQVEAVVLTRGFPQRVQISTDIDDEHPSLTLSTASLVTIAQSTYRNQSLASPQNKDLLSRLTDCSGFGPCWAPRLDNPWRRGRFSPRWFDIQNGIEWAPIWTSRLDGLSEEDAINLIRWSVLSDGQGASGGVIVLMKGANPPRAVLDHEFEELTSELTERGHDVLNIPFDSDWETSRPIAAFVTGTQSISRAIEGNTFTPGSIVDNLTSFGAHPNNFYPDQTEVQVSLGRWISRGVTGIHGTTDEPLNYTFPSRAFLLDYLKGSTLVEAFSRHIPYLPWQNLILGDPMMAPYMARPTMNLRETPSGDHEIEVTVPSGQRLTSLSIWKDRELLQRSNVLRVNLCFPASTNVLVIAETEPLNPSIDDSQNWGSGFAEGYAKGWKLLTVPACETEFPDQELTPDASLDLDMSSLVSQPDAADQSQSEVFLPDQEVSFSDSFQENDGSPSNQGCVQPPLDRHLNSLILVFLIRLFMMLRTNLIHGLFKNKAYPS